MTPLEKLRLFLRVLQFVGAITIVFGEAHAEVSFLDLLYEHVLLVEEENNGGGGEVAVVADTVEQVQTFVHSVLKQKCGFLLLSLECLSNVP